MADKTFGVKVSDEMYEKAKLIIDSSGISAKDWFEKAVALYELNSIKQGSSDYTQDLSELEHHTTRIYELIANMIQRSVYLKDHAVKEVSDRLDSKEAIITDLQEKVNLSKAELSEKGELIAIYVEQLRAAEEKLETNRTTIDNIQALISEYKEKNDVLNGLVAQYKSYADENETLKVELNDVQTSLTARALKAEKQVDEFSKELDEVKSAAERTKEQYENSLQMTIERKDLERDRALVEVERRYQEEVNQLNAAHNEEIRSLYNEIAELRRVNEENREKYQVEIEALRGQKDK